MEGTTHSADDQVGVIDRMRVVGTHHSESGCLGREVARVVTTLLIGMPDASIDLDDYPALDQQIDAPDTGDQHLAGARQASVDQRKPYERLDA